MTKGRTKTTQDKIGYHLLREEYARAIGDAILGSVGAGLKKHLSNIRGGRLE